MDPSPTTTKDVSDENDRSDEHRKCVLVVDDRSKSREQIGARLRARGIRVIEAEDGVAAWEAFAEQRPDAVITDMRMPRADGLELLERIREQTDTPTFCITAYPDLDTGLAAMKRGAEYYYRWPLELDRMIEDVDAALAASADRGDSRGEPARTAAELEQPTLTLAEIREAGKSLTSGERKAAMHVALAETRGNVEKAAQLLGISRRSFYHWMDRYGVDRSA